MISSSQVQPSIQLLHLGFQQFLLIWIPCLLDQLARCSRAGWVSWIHCQWSKTRCWHNNLQASKEPVAWYLVDIVVILELQLFLKEAEGLLVLLGVAQIALVAYWSWWQVLGLQNSWPVHHPDVSGVLSARTLSFQAQSQRFKCLVVFWLWHNHHPSPNELSAS